MGIPVKLPPKKAISMVSRFRFSKVDNQVSMVFSTSSPVTAFCLAVIFFWLQKMQSLGQPLWGMKMGMIACFFTCLFMPYQRFWYKTAGKANARKFKISDFVIFTAPPFVDMGLFFVSLEYRVWGYISAVSYNTVRLFAGT